MSIPKAGVVVLALLAAGFGPAVGGVLWELLQGRLFHYRAYEWKTLLGIGLLTYPFGIAFALLIGLPTFLLAQRFHLVRWWVALCVGLLGGCLVELLLFPSAVNTVDILLRSFQGAVSAFLFFLVWWQGSRKPQPVANSGRRAL